MNKDLKAIRKLIGTSKIVRDLSWFKKVIVPKITNNYQIYKNIQDLIGVPAAFTAIIHTRENAQDLGKFKAYLGNGQPFNRVTTIVPKGRGPFKSWEAGAIDAFIMMGLHTVKDWSLEEALYQFERYNGFGYARMGKNSPYVWSFTNHGVGVGKYVADGKYSPTAVSKNIGAYPLYTLLVKADERFTIGEPDESREIYSKEIKEENQAQTGLITYLTIKIKSFFSWLKRSFNGR